MNVTEIFGSMVFNDRAMKERLTEDAYKALKRTIEEGRRLDITLASEIAEAMKDWAIEKGVTHYTHWFQPMTGITAEKHDSFITPTGDDGVIMEFSAKELVMGESDASSFPSGGLRATFEARGYTAWDPTSYAFIKENTLYIPTAFCSYGGQALDKKTPLMRSMEFLNKQTKRILAVFGMNDVKKVDTMTGAEQEYFLIDKEKYRLRKDLSYTGRTLLGAMPPKGQELDDHYYGSIRPRVKAFMKELDEELWKLGVYAKTEHNEAAPSQHELAPVYCSTNTATDQNQLMMETMKKVADKHNLACIFHEKPFDGVNGSGKHINWSVATNTGVNLFSPGDSPAQNKRFLLFLTAVIKAVDEYQELLRISVSSAGNDCRLGAGEAPPAIISVHIGEELESVIEAIIEGRTALDAEHVIMGTGVHVLPKLSKDTTDRNRTSPFAFTGNKFEFRMPGSSFSLAGPNTVLNTAFAKELSLFADELEGSEDKDKTVSEIIKRELTAHKRIIFNGNNYSEEWRKEAEKRGLAVIGSTDEALKYFLDEKNVKLFTENKIYTEDEMVSRKNILLESYYKVINIEARTLTDMVRRELLPAAIKYRTELCNAYNTAKETLSAAFDEELDVLRSYSDSIRGLEISVKSLSETLESACEKATPEEKAEAYRAAVLPSMKKVRRYADTIEEYIPEGYIPYPSYGDLLFDV